MKLIKTNITILFIAFTSLLFAQDTTVAWIKKIDSLSYKTFSDKKYIPREFYKVIGFDSITQVANPNDKWTPSCIGRQHYRLNWIAKDKINHWILSISYGGKSSSTSYYLFDKEKGKLNSNVFSTRGVKDIKTVGTLARDIRNRTIEREDIDE